MKEFDKTFSTIMNNSKVEQKINEASDFPIAEQLEKAKTIDWTRYKAKLAEVLGETVEVNPKVEIRKYWRGEKYYLMLDLDFASGNLVDKVGIWKAAVESIKLSSDTIWVGKVEGQDNNTVAGFETAFSYKHKGGGSNGVRLFYSWYNFDKKTWKFRMEGVQELQD